MSEWEYDRMNVSFHFYYLISCVKVRFKWQGMRVRITRNRNIALIRRHNRRNNSIANFFEDRFWSPELWPDHIFYCFMRFQYTDRICICNFFFGNGLQFEDAFRIISFYHNWNISTVRQYRYTFQDLWNREESAVNRIHTNWEHNFDLLFLFGDSLPCSIF